jgi:hypothetical protein
MGFQKSSKILRKILREASFATTRFNLQCLPGPLTWQAIVDRSGDLSTTLSSRMKRDATARSVMQVAGTARGTTCHTVITKRAGTEARPSTVMEVIMPNDGLEQSVEVFLAQLCFALVGYLHCCAVQSEYDAVPQG